METLILVALLVVIAAVTLSLITTMLAVLRGEPIPWFDAWSRASLGASGPGKALKQQQADADELHRRVAGLQPPPSESPDGEVADGRS